MHPQLLESLAKQRHEEFTIKAKQRYLSETAEQVIEERSSRQTAPFHRKLLIKIADLLIASGTSLKKRYKICLESQPCETP